MQALSCVGFAPWKGAFASPTVLMNSSPPELTLLENTPAPLLGMCRRRSPQQEHCLRGNSKPTWGGRVNLVPLVLSGVLIGLDRWGFFFSITVPLTVPTHHLCVCGKCVPPEFISYSVSRGWRRPLPCGKIRGNNICGLVCSNCGLSGLEGCPKGVFLILHRHACSCQAH